MFSLVLSLFVTFSLVAQNTKTVDSPNGTVISNAGGTDLPHSASILDIRSTNKGILLPRMSTANRDAIASPQPGLLLYNSTSNQFNFHDGFSWQQAAIGNQWNVSGLNYYYNGGNVGIGDDTPDYKLDVAGTTYSSNVIVGNNINSYSINSYLVTSDYYSGLDLSLSYSLRMNSPSHSALLSLKGDNSSFGSWGQHLILENATNADYGGILHDTDGMKFRNFGVNDQFYFRNSNNITIAQIDQAGNTSLDGTLTVNNGKGVAYNTANGNNLKIHRFTTATATAVLGGHERSAEFTIAFGGGFTTTPTVLVGDIETTGGTVGELYMVQLQLYNCNTTSCKARLINNSPNAVNYSITWNCVAIGY